MSSFDSANWHYIKLQSDGIKREPGTFAKLYLEQKGDFEKYNNKLKEWMEDDV